MCRPKYGNTSGYFSGSNEYIRAYLKAKNDYGNYSCSGYKCYLDVIKQDLKPFSQGIDKKMIELTIPKWVDVNELMCELVAY